MVIVTANASLRQSVGNRLPFRLFRLARLAAGIQPVKGPLRKKFFLRIGAGAPNFFCSARFRALDRPERLQSLQRKGGVAGEKNAGEGSGKTAASADCGGR